MIATISTNRWFGLFILITAALFVCDMWVFSAFAENRYQPITIYDALGIPTQCSYSKYVVPHVIECIKEATINTTYIATSTIESYLRYPMLAFLTLTLVHFGYQMLTQEKQMQQKAFILLLKVGFVFWMTNDFGGMIPAVYAIMDEGQALVSQVLFGPSLLSATVPGIGGGMSCPDLGAFYSGGDLWIWTHMSCVLGQLMGYGPNIALSGSLFGLLGAFVGGGALGVTIFFEGLIALVSVIMLILRAVFFYVVAYVMIGFLIIIAPIFLPCIFMKQTFNYFNKWLSNVQSAMINPMIITAYLVLAMMIVDVVLFRGDDSLTGILSSAEMEKCLKSTDIQGDTLAVDVKRLQRAGVSDGSELTSEGGIAAMMPMMAGTTSIMKSLLGNKRVHTIDCDDDPYTDTDEHFEILGNIMMAVLRVLLVIWLLVQVMELVPTIATQISGGGYRLNQVVADSFGKDVETKTQDTMAAAKQSMTKAASEGGPGPGGVESYLNSFDDGLSAAASALTGQRK